MCDLKGVAGLKEVTIYKVAYLVGNDNFYSCFAGTPIKVGTVQSQRFFVDGDLYRPMHRYDQTSNLYEVRMEGKCSGFEKSETAFNLANVMSREGRGIIVVLKIKLIGEIWYGSSLNISNVVPDDEVVFAGTHIESIEVKAHLRSMGSHTYTTTTPIFDPEPSTYSTLEPTYV